MTGGSKVQKTPFLKPGFLKSHFVDSILLVFFNYFLRFRNDSRKKKTKTWSQSTCYFRNPIFREESFAFPARMLQPKKAPPIVNRESDEDMIDGNPDQRQTSIAQRR